MNYPAYDLSRQGPYAEPIPLDIQAIIRRLAYLQSAQIGGMGQLTRVLAGQFDDTDSLDLEVCSFCGDIECDGGCSMRDADCPGPEAGAYPTEREAWKAEFTLSELLGHPSAYRPDRCNAGHWHLMRGVE